MFSFSAILVSSSLLQPPIITIFYILPWLGPCGILHVTKVSSPASPASPSFCEEQFFTMIADDSVTVIHVVVDHLTLNDFRQSQMRFIPYSSRENWVPRYPHTITYVDCNTKGNPTRNVFSSDDLLGGGKATSAGREGEHSSEGKP